MTDIGIHIGGIHIGVSPRRAAQRVLRASALFWAISVFIGQWLFAFYVLGFYGGAVLRGDIAAWNRRLFHGVIEGDMAGNIAVGSHLLLAFLISALGPLQLIPQLRTRYPAFHRMNGRVYIATALLIGLVGLYLLLARGGVSPVGDTALGFNGVLILVFAMIALRHARARDIHRHQRWALRLFLAAGGFLAGRAGFQAWFFLTGGLGHRPDYSGSFDIFWGFGMYLLPLGLLELYFHARDRGGPVGKVLVSSLIVLLTAILLLGVFLVAEKQWLPLLWSGLAGHYGC